MLGLGDDTQASADWRSTQNCISRPVCKGLSPQIDIIEDLSMAKLRWQHIHPIHHLAVWLLSSHSSLSTLQYYRRQLFTYPS